MSMMTSVTVVLISSVLLPLLYSTRYDLKIPLGVIGGCHVTIIEVELILCDVTLIGELGAKKQYNEIINL